MKRTPLKTLKEQIRAAKSVEEIEQLLHEGETYPHASRKTRNRWRNMANRRRSEIGHTADTCE